MTQREIDLIESAIRHIQTSTDVDPWAAEIAVAAMRKQIADVSKKVERTAETAQNTSSSCAHENDLISRKAAIDAIEKIAVNERDTDRGLLIFCGLSAAITVIDDLPSAQPNRKLIDDYMWKIKQNISPHTAAEGVIAIKYYLEQIYEQIYGEGEKPKWMT